MSEPTRWRDPGSNRASRVTNRSSSVPIVPAVQVRARSAGPRLARVPDLQAHGLLDVPRSHAGLGLDLESTLRQPPRGKACDRLRVPLAQPNGDGSPLARGDRIADPAQLHLLPRGAVR